MGFGIDTGISRQTRNTVQRAEKMNEDGEITEFTTFGAMEEKTEESYSSSFTNTATNGQTATTSTGGVMEHTLIESNTDYARETKTTAKPL